MSGTGICLEKNLLCFVMDCEFDPISQSVIRGKTSTQRDGTIKNHFSSQILEDRIVYVIHGTSYLYMILTLLCILYHLYIGMI